MGKIYFIAEAKYGEETITSDELYYIGDHDEAFCLIIFSRSPI